MIGDVLPSVVPVPAVLVAAYVASPTSGMELGTPSAFKTFMSDARQALAGPNPDKATARPAVIKPMTVTPDDRNATRKADAGVGGSERMPRPISEESNSSGRAGKKKTSPADDERITVPDDIAGVPLFHLSPLVPSSLSTTKAVSSTALLADSHDAPAIPAVTDNKPENSTLVPAQSLEAESPETLAAPIADSAVSARLSTASVRLNTLVPDHILANISPVPTARNSASLTYSLESSTSAPSSRAAAQQLSLSLSLVDVPAAATTLSSSSASARAALASITKDDSYYEPTLCGPVVTTVTDQSTLTQHGSASDAPSLPAPALPPAGVAVETAALGLVAAEMTTRSIHGDSALKIRFLVDRASTAALIVNGTAELDRSLNTVGVRLDAVTIGVSGRDLATGSGAADTSAGSRHGHPPYEPVTPVSSGRAVIHDDDLPTTSDRYA